MWSHRVRQNDFTVAVRVHHANASICRFQRPFVYPLNPGLQEVPILRATRPKQSGFRTMPKTKTLVAVRTYGLFLGLSLIMSAAGFCKT